MTLTVDVAGGRTRHLDPDEGATYGSLLAPFDLSRQEVAILVDGRPVPADAPVAPAVEAVRVVRLVRGG